MVATGDGLDEILEEQRRAAATRALASGSGFGVDPRLMSPGTVPSLVPPGAKKSRDTVSIQVQSKQTFLWKDLLRSTDNEALGFIAELVELELSRRGLRR